MINYPSDLLARMDRVTTVGQVFVTPAGYTSIGETGNIFLDGDYFIYSYTCYVGSPRVYSIHYSRAHKTALSTWTYMGVLSLAEELEDPYIRKIDGVYHLTAENKTHEKSTGEKVISEYTSPDFITWTDQGIILVKSVSGWDSEAVYSPGDVEEDSVRYLFYDGRVMPDVPHVENIGYATYNGSTFDKYSGNPVLETIDCPGFDVIGFDNIFKCENSYVMNITGLRGYYDPLITQEWISGIATSNNLSSGWELVASYILNELDEKLRIIPFYYEGWHVLYSTDLDDTHFLGTPIDSDLYTADFHCHRT